MIFRRDTMEKSPVSPVFWEAERLTVNYRKDTKLTVKGKTATPN